MSCIVFELFCRVPAAELRLRLCRWHVDRCVRCRRASESEDTLPPILVAAARLPAGLDLWPGVQRGIDGLSRPAMSPATVSLPARGSWRWAYAAALAALLVIGAWIMILDWPSRPLVQSAQFTVQAQTRLFSAKIADRQARVFQIQSRNPDRAIFWIAKDDPRS